jgi:hypothetical protein
MIRSGSDGCPQVNGVFWPGSAILCRFSSESMVFGVSWSRLSAFEEDAITHGGSIEPITLPDGTCRAFSVD